MFCHALFSYSSRGLVDINVYLLSSSVYENLRGNRRFSIPVVEVLSSQFHPKSLKENFTVVHPISSKMGQLFWFSTHFPHELQLQET